MSRPRATSWSTDIDELHVSLQNDPSMLHYVYPGVDGIMSTRIPNSRKSALVIDFFCSLFAGAVCSVFSS